MVFVKNRVSFSINILTSSFSGYVMGKNHVKVGKTRKNQIFPKELWFFI